MFTRFVYSLNGVDYLGAFETREAAQAAAFRAAHRLPQTPESIFVARSTLPDPRADGFARTVISLMNTRAQAAGDNYLAKITEAEEHDLDGALEAAILTWLARNDRAPGVYQLEAVSEVPVPNAQQHLAPCGEESEVYDLGPEAAPSTF